MTHTKWTLLVGAIFALLNRLFQPFAGAALGAKTGVVTAPSGTDNVIKALGDANPVTNTLAGIMRDAFGAATLEKAAIINLANRTVTIVPAATNMDNIANETGIDPVATITRDDATKAVSPLTATDDDGGTLSPRISAIVEAAKPALSIESLVNKIEDAFADQTGVFEGKSGIIVVNQAGDGTVSVFKGDADDVAAWDPAAEYAEDAHFVQTLSLPGERQFAE